ncbi:uncharacterized protein BDR25DRAFT_352132 [Lindgomyces ingoldianus]|uniref:Uncharacterized protein n=1 Tax=Lindgomyces ingoldianus TaxID=673940 RepID=A0ACB6R2Z8_9PLEO|nr:uncharacterized protein BDR25DRAFT_352132 [Lindgomyces ingoldianus]KAF2473638.1 hypothetical protein BDR25DRAFT_352132 [Lindgomyces ingoldianus]
MAELVMAPGMSQSLAWVRVSSLSLISYSRSNSVQGILNSHNFGTASLIEKRTTNLRSFLSSNSITTQKTLLVERKYLLFCRPLHLLDYLGSANSYGYAIRLGDCSGNHYKRGSLVGSLTITASWYHTTNIFFRIELFCASIMPSLLNQMGIFAGLDNIERTNKGVTAMVKGLAVSKVKEANIEAKVADPKAKLRPVLHPAVHVARQKIKTLKALSQFSSTISLEARTFFYANTWFRVVRRHDSYIPLSAKFLLAIRQEGRASLTKLELRGDDFRSKPRTVKQFLSILTKCTNLRQLKMDMDYEQVFINPLPSIRALLSGTQPFGPGDSKEFLAVFASMSNLECLCLRVVLGKREWPLMGYLIRTVTYRGNNLLAEKMKWEFESALPDVFHKRNKKIQSDFPNPKGVMKTLPLSCLNLDTP